jgi:2,3-dihydroxyphenylpropionate 1,2-dioxygenase
MFQLTCVSHGPALATPLSEPREHAAVKAAYAARAAALEAFDPELIVIFAPDHYTDIHLELVPPFCIGLRREAVADYGGFPGLLNVPAELALQCVQWRDRSPAWREATAGKGGPPDSQALRPRAARNQ